MIVLKERYDNSKLIKLYDKLVSKHYSPLWVDPYCVFVCKVDDKNYIYRANGNKIDRKVIGEQLTL
jgi:hypothetical protein